MRFQGERVLMQAITEGFVIYGDTFLRFHKKSLLITEAFLPVISRDQITPDTAIAVETRTTARIITPAIILLVCLNGVRSRYSI